MRSTRLARRGFSTVTEQRGTLGYLPRLLNSIVFYCCFFHFIPASALTYTLPSPIETKISAGFFELMATVATFLIPLPTSFQDAPASTLLKSPSRMAAYMIFGSPGFTARPFTVLLVGRPPTSNHPQKQSGLRCNPVDVPA